MRVRSISNHIDITMKKDKNTAAILALFLGFLGIHRFYLGQKGLGILYLMLAFAFPVSLILGFIDAIVLFTKREEDFDYKYNREIPRSHFEQRRPQHQRYGQYPPILDVSPAPQPFQYQQQNRQKAEAFKQSGIKKFKDYDLQGAIVDFEQALSVNPVDIASHFNVACAYSMIENAQKGFFHLSEAIRLGFKEFEKIKSHDSLAYLRIQQSWDKFVASDFKYSAIQADFTKEDYEDKLVIDTGKNETIADNNNDLLAQLQKLAEFKEKGILSEVEFEVQKKRLLG